ncbi:MAG: hypothetical protein ACKVZJ_07320 [Phycisphaerales bacterium]
MSRMTSMTYEFGRRTGVCAVTGRGFAPAEHYIATLVETPTDEGETLARVDYSLDAWASSVRPERLFAFWKTTYEDRDDGRTRLVDDASLLSMFEQLEGVTEPRRVAFRYVLALLLIRKRLLVHAGEKAGVLLVQEKLTGPGSVAAQAKAPVIEVSDPKLDAAAVAEVTQQLESVLRAGA